jgi:predicted O-methyltransferase YrrM
MNTVAMNNHTDLLNYLIALRGLTSYLEIGTDNPDFNFDHIKAERKVSVDPAPHARAIVAATSDEYFRLFHDKYDVIFIDGLHHAAQVKKDFDNALEVLSEKGFIVLHDCNPHAEHITHVPRDRAEWCGDVYRFACTLSEYAGIDYVTVDFDYGCTVVWRAPAAIKGNPVGPVTWERFVREKATLLRLVTKGQFVARMS